MTLGREALAALRGFGVVDLHEPACGDLGHEHLGDQRQGLVKGRVDAGDDQQEHEQHEEVDLPGEDQLRPGQDRGRHAQAHDDAGGVHKDAGGELALQHGFFVGVDLVAQRLEEAALLIGRPDLPDVFQGLLDAVGHGDGRGLGDLGAALRQLAAAEQQREGHRDAPEAGQRQLPVIGEEHDGDQRRGNVGAVEIAQTVGPDVLQPVHVAHDGLGEIGQVTLAEVAQGELAQTLGQGNAHVFHFAVDQAVGRLVLLQVGDKGEQQEDQDHQQDRQRLLERRSVGQRGQQPLHHEVEDAHAAHHDQVHDDGPEGARFGVLDPLIAERVLALKCFSEHLIPPPFHRKSSTEQPVDSPPTCGHRVRLLSAAHRGCPARRRGRRPAR